MTNHVRKVAVAVGAGALIASTLLTAAPASAATSITAASCTAEGGTFTRVKGVKTCVVTAGNVRYVYENTPYTATVFGPFASELLTDPGYVAEWKYYIGYRDVTTSTQKGKGEIGVTTVSNVVRRSSWDLACFSTPDGFNLTGTITAFCSAAGLYPANIG